MRILITGAGGMLGSDLAARLGSKHEVMGVGRRPAPHLRIPYQVLDLWQAKETEELFRTFRPEVVLHAAAMTDVDRCETERSQAMRGNLDLTRIIADASSRRRALLIFFSTDYVFDGTKAEPYVENDLPHPVNVYGESKFLAERYLLIRGDRFLILRTSWTFGKHGNHFIKKVLQKAESGQRLEVVSDQVGSPTFTADLAEGVVRLMDLLPEMQKACENQIYHIANEGKVSRYELAQAVLKKRNYPLNRVTAIPSEKLSLPARRPKNSVLSTEKLHEHFGIQLRNWEAALEDYLQEEAGVAK